MNMLATVFLLVRVASLSTGARRQRVHQFALRMRLLAPFMARKNMEKVKAVKLSTARSIADQRKMVVQWIVDTTRMLASLHQLVKTAWACTGVRKNLAPSCAILLKWAACRRTATNFVWKPRLVARSAAEMRNMFATSHRRATSVWAPTGALSLRALRLCQNGDWSLESLRADG